MNFMQSLSYLARTLLLMSATGSVIVLLLLILKPIIKNYIPKYIQYYLWVLVVIAFLVPFSSFVSLPFVTPMIPLQEIVDENIRSTVERQDKIAQDKYGKEYDALEPEEQIDISFKEIGLSKGKFQDYILSVLVTVGGITFLISIIQYAIYSMKLRRNRFESENNELILLYGLCKNRKCPKLYRNALASTPMLIGIFRPTIYLPNIEYSAAQLQNILLHELTHLRRHDVFIKWITTLAVHIHWFNPIAYFVRKEIDRACELACDEAVIHNLGTDGKQHYGDTLIEMSCETKKSRTIISTTMCEDKKTFKERLKAIMESKRYTKTVIAFSCVLLLVAFGTVALLGASAKRETAADSLYEKFKNEHSTIRPESIITEVNAGEKTTVVFYYNANGNLGCSVVEKTLFGYEPVKTGAELTVEYATPVSAMAGQYDDAEKWCVWGILRDNSIENVVVYGQEAVIVDAVELRFFYKLGNGLIPDGSGSFCNNTGELVWEIPSL